MMTLGRSTAYAVWAAVMLLAAPRESTAQEPYAGLDAYITNALPALKVPGAAVVIVRNDSIIYAKGFGVLGINNRAPVNDQTLFEIGSSGKSFTATLTAMMVSDGKMQYDDLISKYLPDFKLYDPTASSQVTVRDALEHRTGIARGEAMWYNGGTREDVLHRVRFLKPEVPFRSRWIYQNIMYLAAGEAAGRAGGSTWDALIQQRIFAPLGMTSSLTTVRDLKTSNAAIAHGIERDSVFTKPYQNSDNIAPAGAILSNARDMGQWLRFHMNDGVVSGKRLVSSAALRETHTPQMIMTGGGGGGEFSNFSTYGMGWMIQDYRGELEWQHGGNTIGMTTAMGMLPNKKIGVVILSNMDHTQLPALLMRYIFDRQLGVTPVRDYVSEMVSRQRARGNQATGSAPVHTSAPPPLPLSAYVGTYADSLYGELTVAIKDGKLQLTRGSQFGPLEYWNANNFRWWSNADLGLTPYIKFDISPDNRVTGVYFGSGAETSLLGRKNADAGRGPTRPSTTRSAAGFGGARATDVPVRRR
jgi:CubicO group peptidase (beta-lactamase class C family)